MDELKSCPFCGGKAMFGDEIHPRYIFCTSCYARVTGRGYGEKGEQDAVRRWNMRTNSKEN